MNQKNGEKGGRNVQVQVQPTESPDCVLATGEDQGSTLLLLTLWHLAAQVLQKGLGDPAKLCHKLTTT